jgi:hypothetical protein
LGSNYDYNESFYTSFLYATTKWGPETKCTNWNK